MSDTYPENDWDQDNWAKQRVWRTLSSDAFGYYIWDVIEVTGETDRTSRTLPKGFVECIDGRYILVQCYHFWTKERAIEFLYNNEYTQWQQVYIVSGMPDLTASEYKEWLAS